MHACVWVSGVRYRVVKIWRIPTAFENQSTIFSANVFPLISMQVWVHHRKHNLKGILQFYKRMQEIVSCLYVEVIHTSQGYLYLLCLQETTFVLWQPWIPMIFNNALFCFLLIWFFFIYMMFCWYVLITQQGLLQILFLTSDKKSCYCNMFSKDTENTNLTFPLSSYTYSTQYYYICVRYVISTISN